MSGQRRSFFSSRGKLARGKLVRSGFFIWLAAATLPSITSASIIFTNFGPGLSYDITEGNGVGNDFVGDTLAEGDSFTAVTNSIFGSVSVALSCGAFTCPASDTFTVALTADNGDAPGTAIESFLFTGLSLSGLNNNNSLIMATSILKPTLTAGTLYWITVSSSSSYSIVWNLNSTSSTVDQAQSTDGGDSWFAPSGLTPSAFEVDSAPAGGVPEPSTGVLLGGVMLLGLFGHRFIRRPKV